MRSLAETRVDAKHASLPDCPGAGEQEAEEAAIEHFTREFRQAVTDPSSFGPAKAMTNAMLADGIDLLDPEAVQAWIEAFNARPFEERDEFLAGPLPDLGTRDDGS